MDEYHYEINPKGHVWEQEEDYEEVNFFAYNIDFHNGPRCVNCGYEFCHHCIDNENMKPCVCREETDADARNKPDSSSSTSEVERDGN
ncbi:MAG: hypothetical protein GY737_00080 [Desulfobacteraceae bacterium]|nr:hypothetical protein [Desulfobacteraceae bacterium]